MRNPLRDPRYTVIFTAKRRMGRVLCSPTVGAAVRRMGRGVVFSKHLRIDTRSSEVSDVSRARLFWGLYEGAEIRLLKRHLMPTSTIVDLGASLGVLSSAAARQVGGRVRMICVEANPELIRLAERNIGANAPLAEVTVIHGAVDGDARPGEIVSFRKGMKEHTGASLARVATEVATGSDGAFSAPVVRLGTLLSDYHITDEYVLLADIEGAEAGLFLSEEAALEGCCQMIVEFHDTEFRGIFYSASDLRQIALSKGFECVATYGSVSVLNRMT